MVYVAERQNTDSRILKYLICKNKTNIFVTFKKVSKKITKINV